MDRKHGRGSAGFTMIELMVAVAIIGIVAAIGAPGLIRARMTGNEASAIASLRAISTGEYHYASSCGAGGYAQSLTDLVTPPSGTNQGFVSPDLNSNGVLKSGYIVNLLPDASATIVTSAAGTCNGSAAVSAYFVENHPLTVSTSGQRSFAIDVRGSIFFRTDGAAIAPGMAGASVLH